MSKNLVFTTSSYYPAECPRMRCAVETVRLAGHSNIPIVVVDGGSPASFIEEIKDLGAIVLDEVSHAPGVMGPGRRQAIEHGFKITGGRISGYIEIEKSSMVDSLEWCSQPVLDGQTNLNVPRRRWLDSYPTAQQFAEPLGNLYFRQVTGLNLDVWFGPRIFDAKSGKHFLEYSDEYGGAWDPTLVPVMRTAAAGLKIAATSVAYYHPRLQTLEEENSAMYTEKRAAQLANLFKAIGQEARRLELPNRQVEILEL